MKRRKNALIAFLLTVSIVFFCSFGDNKNLNHADVVVYGGTSAGISAAIQTARLGKSVILIEPTNRLGGLTTGGLGRTDTGNKRVIGGISREFYQNIKKYYADTTNWIWEKRSEYKPGIKEEDAMWAFEPSVALKVYHEMMNGLDICVVYNQRLERLKGVIMKGNAIQSIRMESGQIYTGKVFMDATYEGDLMASAGVSYALGRESNAQYGETLNGIQANLKKETMTGKIAQNAFKHNFIDGVDPYIVKGDSTSGLLPFISGDSLEDDGIGDHKIQAYCFRMTLTNHPDNRIPFEKPDNYKEVDYELLFRNYEASTGPIEKMYSYGGGGVVPWINAAMPNRKTDTNNGKGFSTDFVGQNWDYPEASYEEREKIIIRHRAYQQGLMWTLAYHPRIPEKVRRVVSQWGTCKDEYEREDGWPDQLYIREARRMIGSYVMTQKNCECIEIVDDPVGMGAYTMDSHHVQRYVNAQGYVMNEGNVEAPLKYPYSIGYRSIVPKKEECSNLIVPVCVSASHIAFGSIRMEPVFMILGQSAALIANLAIDANKAVQDLEYNELKNELVKYGQVIE